MIIRTQTVDYRSPEEFEFIPNELRIGSVDLYDRELEERLYKPHQFAKALPEEKVGFDCVQSFISNMSTATSIEELLYFEDFSLPENILSGTENEWTSPKWAKAGDIVFFMHSKTARSTITRLRTEIVNNRNEFESSEYDRLLKYIEHALEVHDKYGGKIFAIGRISGGTEMITSEDIAETVFHWKSRTYYAIDNIVKLHTPVDISEFNSFIQVSRGSAITPLYDEEFIQLRNLILEHNTLPAYITDCVAKPIPLRLINKNNWISVANDYRRCFILEKQFRKFYVDYLISYIGDKKSFYTECRCQRDDINDSFMDYVMLFDKKYLPVEVKLSVSAEPNILSQVRKYVHNTRIYLTHDRKRVINESDMHSTKVLIIDTDKIYVYDSLDDKISVVFTLDQIQSKDDLEELRKLLATKIVNKIK